MYIGNMIPHAPTEAARIAFEEVKKQVPNGWQHMIGATPKTLTTEALVIVETIFILREISYRDKACVLCKTNVNLGDELSSEINQKFYMCKACDIGLTPVLESDSETVKKLKTAQACAVGEGVARFI